MRRRPLLAAVAAGVAATLAVVPVVAADPEAALVNEELVVAQVDASGLPVEATLYSRLVARDFPVGQVRDPSSTTDVTYIDRRGAPATDGDAVLVDIGGNGQTSVTTRATFDKPFPSRCTRSTSRGRRSSLRMTSRTRKDSCASSTPSPTPRRPSRPFATGTPPGAGRSRSNRFSPHS